MRILILSDFSIYKLKLSQQEKLQRAFYEMLDIQPLTKFDYFLGKTIELEKPPDKRIFYWNFSDYQYLLEEVNPELILMAGDIFHPNQNDEDLKELNLLFEYINDKAIQCYIIEGNWELKYYNKILQLIKDYDLIEDISNREIEFLGLRILGINFEYANRIGICKRFKAIFSNEYDIVLSHAPQNRRIWLFDLNTKFIITGHSGIDLGKVKNKIYLANDYSPEYYFVIDYFSEDSQKITCFCNNEIYSEVTINKNKFLWKRKMKPYNRLSGYTTKKFREVIKLKNEFEKTLPKKQQEIILDLIRKNKNVSWIREYLGRQYFKDEKNFVCEICGMKFHRAIGLNNHKKIVHK